MFVFEQEEENRQQEEMKEFVRFFSSRVDTGCTDFVVIVLALCVVQIYGTDGLSTDGLALLDFKNGLISKNILESWNASDVSPCNWEGVVCSGSDGLVTALLLFNAGLYGSISPSLGNLQALKYLNLSANSLTGEIPLQLASISSLETLDLSSNKLTGLIPPDLGNLMELHLHNNKLNGTLPPSLGTSLELWSFDVHGNSISGSIPELIYCINLAYLDMSDNELSGQIILPISLVSLQFLNLSYNHLVGPIPLFVFYSNSLIKVDLSYNFLIGSNSAIFASGSHECKACAPLLQELYLQGNSLQSKV